MISIEQDGVRVELEDIGEGYSGEYDPGDPDDKPLLRFTVCRFDADSAEWGFVDDASYCTGLSADLDPETQELAAAYLHAQVFRAVAAGESVKKLCEELSWIGTDGFPLPLEA